jgi:hypothetical protein
MSTRSDAELDELFDRLRRDVPVAAGFIDWVRSPAARFVRIPLGLVLIVGGILSFLPILGIWMLPLGLLILAIDVPFLRRPVVRAVLWIEEKWHAWRDRRKRR